MLCKALRKPSFIVEVFDPRRASGWPNATSLSFVSPSEEMLLTLLTILSRSEYGSWASMDGSKLPKIILLMSPTISNISWSTTSLQACVSALDPEFSRNSTYPMSSKSLSKARPLSSCLIRRVASRSSPNCTNWMLIGRCLSFALGFFCGSQVCVPSLVRLSHETFDIFPHSIAISFPKTIS